MIWTAHTPKCYDLECGLLSVTSTLLPHGKKDLAGEKRLAKRKASITGLQRCIQYDWRTKWSKVSGGIAPIPETSAWCSNLFKTTYGSRSRSCCVRSTNRRESSLAPWRYAAGLVGSWHRHNVQRSSKIFLLRESESSHQHWSHFQHGSIWSYTNSV